MAVRPKGNAFQVDFMHAGKRYRPTFDTRSEAEAWELDAKARLLRGQPIDDPTKEQSGAAPGTIGGLVTYVSEHHWKGKKAASTLIKNGELFAAFVGPKVAVSSALTTERINAYCRDLETRGRSGSTVNRHLSAISTLIRFAEALGRIERKPALTWQKEGDGRLRFFEEDEARTLIAFTRQMSRDDEAQFFEFLLDSGARLGEALKLRWPDIARDYGRVTFMDTKNGENRTIALASRSRRNLAAIKVSVRGADPGPFSNFNKDAMIRLWRRLQTNLPFLADCVPHHTFRHTTASWLVQRGIDLYRVKTFMGHKAMTTTERYAHLAPKHMDALAAALDDDYREAAE